MDYDRSEMPSAYDAGRSYAPWVLERWLETVAQQVQGPVSRILDLGCGTGRYSAALANYFSVDVEAIDPSEKMLEQALKKPHARVRFRKASGEALPLNDESVELVFMSMVFITSLSLVRWRAIGWSMRVSSSTYAARAAFRGGARIPPIK